MTSISFSQLAARDMRMAQKWLHVCRKGFHQIADDRLDVYLKNIHTKLYQAGKHLQQAGVKKYPQMRGMWKVLNTSRKNLVQRLAERQTKPTQNYVAISRPKIQRALPNPSLFDRIRKAVSNFLEKWTCCFRQ